MAVLLFSKREASFVLLVGSKITESLERITHTVHNDSCASFSYSSISLIESRSVTHQRAGTLTAVSKLIVHKYVRQPKSNVEVTHSAPSCIIRVRGKTFIHGR